MSDKKINVKSALGSILKHMADGSNPATKPADGGDTAASNSTDDIRDEKRARTLMAANVGRIETVTVREVDTKRVRLWAHHNRLYGLLNEEYCEDLITSFKAQGQSDPAIVRKLRDDPEFDYEIIAGARRLWTARHLGRLLKIEVQDLSDEAAFLVSDASNKGKDISEYERAKEFKAVLNALFGGSQARMSEKTGYNLAKISRYLALGDLDERIVKAFADPREITIHQAHMLRPLLASTAKRAILERAEEIFAAQQSGAHKTAREVFKALIGSAKLKKEPKSEKYLNEAGQVFLTIEQGRGRRFKLDLNLANGSIPEVISALNKHFKATID